MKRGKTMDEFDNMENTENTDGFDNKEARTWAILCHVSALFAITCIIGPLIIWLIKKGESKFLDAHAKEALNFQISIFIYSMISIPLMFLFCIGWFMLMAVGVMGFVLSIVAAIKASNDEYYRYPLCIRLIS
jgi:uncharacterized protein